MGPTCSLGINALPRRSTCMPRISALHERCGKSHGLKRISSQNTGMAVKRLGFRLWRGWKGKANRPSSGLKPSYDQMPSPKIFRARPMDESRFDGNRCDNSIGTGASHDTLKHKCGPNSAYLKTYMSLKGTCEAKNLNCTRGSNLPATGGPMASNLESTIRNTCRLS